MSNTQPIPRFSDLMAKTGYFVLHWSMFELALQETILAAQKELGQEPRIVSGGLKDRLEAWIQVASQLPQIQFTIPMASEVCIQALKLREIRNIIVHGLAGGDSRPKDPTPGYYIRCMEGGFEAPTGKSIDYTMSDLEHFAQGIDACRRALTNLRSFNYRV